MERAAKPHSKLRPGDPWIKCSPFLKFLTNYLQRDTRFLLSSLRLSTSDSARAELPTVKGIPPVHQLQAYFPIGKMLETERDLKGSDYLHLFHLLLGRD